MTRNLTNWPESPRKLEGRLMSSVTERTAELRGSDAHPAELAKELAALRRVATLVAQGVPPVEIFSAVSAEVGRLFGTDMAAVGRLDPDGPANVVVGVAKSFEGLTVGSRFELDDSMTTAEVYRTGRAARVDAQEWSAVSGPIGAAGRRLGVVSTVSSPIFVEGRLWGAMTVSADAPLPPNTEERLANFTALVAAPLANAQARAEAERLAEEQAALRRVATMVARERPPEEIFVKVAEEMGRLFRVEAAAVQRYEPNGGCTVVGSWGTLRKAFPLGSRLEVDGDSVVAFVYRTGRSVRVDNYEQGEGSVLASAREVGLRGGVGGPIIVNGRLWGVMGIATSRPEDLPADVESRIAQFTELVGTAISNLQTRSDLAASRARVVAASDETRRQIERDLHDGAQQRLVLTVINLKTAREAVLTEPEAVPALVANALDHAEQATVELRELVHGILPPVLAHGLGAAVKSLASRLSIPVDIDVAVDRLPAGIEATGYFIVAEALTNVAKHARASHATVLARVEDGSLHLEVRDDGVGGARADGSGFIGLADRLAVFDGQLRVESPAGEGTVVTTDIPGPD